MARKETHNVGVVNSWDDFDAPPAKSVTCEGGIVPVGLGLSLYKNIYGKGQWRYQGCQPMPRKNCIGLIKCAFLDVTEENKDGKAAIAYAKQMREKYKSFEFDGKAQPHLKFASKGSDGLKAVLEKYADQIAAMAELEGIKPAEWLNTLLYVNCRQARIARLKHLLADIEAQGYAREEIRDCAAEGEENV